MGRRRSRRRSRSDSIARSRRRATTSRTSRSRSPAQTAPSRSATSMPGIATSTARPTASSGDATSIVHPDGRRLADQVSHAPSGRHRRLPPRNRASDRPPRSTRSELSLGSRTGRPTCRLRGSMKPPRSSSSARSAFQAMSQTLPSGSRKLKPQPKPDRCGCSSTSCTSSSSSRTSACAFGRRRLRPRS